MSPRAHGWRPTPLDHPAHDLGAAHVLKLGARLAASPALPPVAVDLEHLVADVLDQGATNACVAHAIAQAIRMRAQAIYPGILPPPLPSRRALYRDALGFAEAHRGEPVVDAGTTFGDMLSGAWIAGVVPEHVWPWDARAVLADLPPTVLREGADRRWTIDSYVRLDDEDRAGAIRRSLALAHPVVLGIVIDEALEDPLGPELVADLGEPIGGHALCAVGYDADGVRVVNSWAPSWRDRGFARLAWSLVESDRVGEAWAISVAPPGWSS